MPFSDKAEIFPIPCAEIGQYQNFVIPLIKSALEHTDGETDYRHILSGIATQKRQLWLIRDKGEFIGMVVTQMYKTPTGQKIGEITLASGVNYDRWNHFIDVVGFWFKDMGCACVQVIGRGGWEKMLKNKGFTKRYTVLRRAI